MRTPHLPRTHADSPVNALLWLMLAGNAMAALDLVVAAAYWMPRGITVERMLQGFAEWVIGVSAYQGGNATALLGAFVYGMALSAALVSFHATTKRWPPLIRHPAASGALFGAACYVALFHVLSPLLTGRSPSAAHVEWIAICLVVFVVAIGIPGALLSRALHRGSAQPVGRVVLRGPG